MRTLIPKVVLDHMGGAEIYPHTYFARNSNDVQVRAVEDTKYLLAINFSGYEDYPQPITTESCRNFLKRAAEAK